MSWSTRSLDLRVPAFTDSPFALLTAVAAPAVLTNACSVLALGTANRVARVVDRRRVVADHLARLSAQDKDHNFWVLQMEHLGLRSKLLVNALSAVYSALGGFAVSALVAVIGGVLAYYEFHFLFRLISIFALVIGVLAVSCLALGCSMIVRETRFALRSNEQEVELALRHSAPTT